MARAVSDSSILIHLGAIERLNLLVSAFDSVTIPGAVWDEVVTQGRSERVVGKIRESARDGWLRVEQPMNSALAQALRQALHAGEAEAISLALETKPICCSWTRAMDARSLEDLASGRGA